MDVDFVADLQPEQAEEFVDLLQAEFYVDIGAIREAIRRQRSFNLIHTASVYKFDIFPLRKDAYSRVALRGVGSWTCGRLAARLSAP